MRDEWPQGNDANHTRYTDEEWLLDAATPPCHVSTQDTDCRSKKCFPARVEGKGRVSVKSL